MPAVACFPVTSVYRTAGVATVAVIHRHQQFHFWRVGEGRREEHGAGGQIIGDVGLAVLGMGVCRCGGAIGACICRGVPRVLLSAPQPCAEAGRGRVDKADRNGGAEIRVGYESDVQCRGPRECEGVEREKRLQSNVSMHGMRTGELIVYNNMRKCPFLVISMMCARDLFPRHYLRRAS